MTEKKKVHIGVFKQVKPGTSQAEKDKLLIRTKEDAVGLQTYYREYARHVWDVRCEGFVMEGEENAHPPAYAQHDVSRFIIDHPEEMGDFKPNYFHIHGGWSEGYCGQGNKPGNRSVRYSLYACGLKTSIHELGHNFNLHHASTFNQSTDKYVEYGDSTSIMSSIQSIRGLNSVEVLRLGFESEREIKRVTETQQVLICPIEMSKHGMHESEFQHVVIEKDGKRYHVSLRKSKGVAYGSGSRYASTLYVHEWTRDGHSVAQIPSMDTPGPDVSKTIEAIGVRIEYLEYANETARINIIFGDDSVPENVEIPLGFPKNIEGVSLEPKHSGAWYDAERNGQGFDIHIKNGKMVFYWYTFNYKQTSRRFYFATCDVGEGLEEFDIYTTEDGTWQDPTLHTAKVVGKGQLYFLDDNNGIFLWNTSEHGRGDIEITPVALASDNPANGSYYQPSRNGEGFTMQFFDHLNLCTAFWYSYGPIQRAPYQTYKGNMKQRWYTCTGAKNEDGTYDLNVYEVYDKVWMELSEYDPENSHATKVGTAKVEIIDNNNIKFDFDIDAERVEGKGTYDLERLF